MEAGNVESAKIAQKYKNEYNNIFTGIGCFKCTLHKSVMIPNCIKSHLDVLHMHYKK